SGERMNPSCNGEGKGGDAHRDNDPGEDQRLGYRVGCTGPGSECDRDQQEKDASARNVQRQYLTDQMLAGQGGVNAQGDEEPGRDSVDRECHGAVSLLTLDPRPPAKRRTRMVAMEMEAAASINRIA